MWKANISTFSENYRTYAIDTISDVGRSIYTNLPKNAADFSNWLTALFDSLSLGDTTHLLGMSYGGWIAAQYALHFPGRLSKLVLIAPAATVCPIKASFYVRALSIKIHRLFIKHFIFWLYKDFARRNEFCRTLLNEVVLEFHTGQKCYKSQPVVLPTVLTDDELQNLRIPTLFLQGENEVLYSAKKATLRLNKIAPHITTETIAHTGHDLTFSCPEPVNTIVRNFLDNVTP